MCRGNFMSVASHPLSAGSLHLMLCAPQKTASNSHKGGGYTQRNTCRKNVKLVNQPSENTIRVPRSGAGNCCHYICICINGRQFLWEIFWSRGIIWGSFRVLRVLDFEIDNLLDCIFQIARAVRGATHFLAVHGCLGVSWSSAGNWIGPGAPEPQTPGTSAN